MENEIMVNNEVIENAMEVDTEQIATEQSGKGLLIAAGVGVALVVGGIVYKKVIKPAIAKVKAKKEAEITIEADVEESIDDEEAVED